MQVSKFEYGTALSHVFMQCVFLYHNTLTLVSLKQRPPVLVSTPVDKFLGDLRRPLSTRVAAAVVFGHEANGGHLHPRVNHHHQEDAGQLDQHLLDLSGGRVCKHPVAVRKRLPDVRHQGVDAGGG